MNLDELIARHPRLYHMAEDGSWPLIQRIGLLSTERLVDAFQLSGEARAQILSQRRPTGVTITSDDYGAAVVRDQIPLREGPLANALEDGMSTTEWYELLNSFVFFWPTEERLGRLLSARAYRDRSHTVLIVDTEKLVASHGDLVHLSPINSGSTIFKPRPRGRATIQLVRDYAYNRTGSHGSGGGAVAEVAVKGGVVPIEQSLISVTRRRMDVVLEELWHA
jgi:hypothetical protein